MPDVIQVRAKHLHARVWLDRRLSVQMLRPSVLKSIMRKIFLIALALGAVFLMQTRAVSANNATCLSDPQTLHVGAHATIQCAGFSPDTSLWAYAVEPNGAALAINGTPFFNNLGGPLKSDAQGNVTFTFQTRLSTDFALDASGIDYYAQLGDWTFVVQQLAPGGKVAQQAQARVHVNGGAESVGGAHLSIAPDTVVKGSDTTFSIYGSGFGANEVVTIWVEQPAWCSGRVQHYAYGAPYAQFFVSGVSTLFWDDAKTDAAGNFVYTDFLAVNVCDGERHFVARGNTSGRGAEANLLVMSSAVDENAWLDVSPNVASALDATITFHAQGFDGNEMLSCWTTTPDGRALAFPYDGVMAELKTDSSGSAQFALTTGAVHNALVPSILGSEGALGEWNMSCRGNTSGRVGIARYVLTGGVIDP